MAGFIQGRKYGTSIYWRWPKIYVNDHPITYIFPFNSSALHIAHALKATEVQRKYSKPHEQPIETYLDREEQVELEAKHKEEEDR